MSGLSAKLLIVKGPFAGRSFTLNDDAFSIGRQVGNDLQLRQPEVSRQHCVIRRAADHFTLHDLDSRQGTFVNEVPVRRRRLESEDLLVIGGTEILFLSPDVGEPSEATGGDSRLAASTLELEPATARYLETSPPRSPLPNTEQVVRDLGTLFGLSRALLKLSSAEELAQELLTLLLHSIPANRGAVLLFEDQGVPRPAAVRTQADENEAFELDELVTQKVREERVAFVVTDFDAAIPQGMSSQDPEVHSLLCVPLLARNQLLGLLYFDKKEPPALDEQHLELAAAAAATAALALDNAQHVAWLRSENRRLQEEELEHELLAESLAMAKALALLPRVAPTDSNVLLRGESGTGKELVARAIHSGSRRAAGPFVAINCATLSETLLESELFGHEKGAFTGAATRRHGKIETAHGGTLFLDEVGEIPQALQARLLRALEERSFERVGGNRAIEVDFRLLTATNRDLESAIREGAFREDLFYRLNVITITLPPLRDRQGDVALLARHFSGRFGRRLGRTVIGPTSEALALLEAYAWPGNVRQLKNVIERAVVLGDGEFIRPEDLSEELLESGRPTSGIALGNYQTTLNATKKALIRDALEHAEGDLPQAAERLGIHLNSLHRLIRNLGLKSELLPPPPRS